MVRLVPLFAEWTEASRRRTVVYRAAPDGELVSWQITPQMWIMVAVESVDPKVVSPLRNGDTVQARAYGAGGRLFHGYARAHSLAGPEHGGASIPTGSARSGRIHRRSHR